jgi:hypothetical protein
VISTKTSLKYDIVKRIHTHSINLLSDYHKASQDGTYYVDMGVQDSTIKNNVEQCDLTLKWSKMMRIFTQ